MAFCVHSYVISHVTHEGFLPCIENGIPPNIPCNNPPSPMCVVFPQHILEILLGFNFGTFLVLMCLRILKIAALSIMKQKPIFCYIFNEWDLWIWAPQQVTKFTFSHLTY